MRTATLISALLSVLLLSGWGPTDTRPMQLVLTSSSKVWVEGTSTIHDWSCAAETFVGVLGVDAASDEAQPLARVTKADITISARALTCGSGKMNGKAQNALATADHPYIRYSLSTSELRAPKADGWTELATTGELEIAGTTRTVDMTVQVKLLANGQYRFKGELPIKMSTFNVEPPTALLGTITTGDDIVVHFDVTADTNG